MRAAARRTRAQARQLLSQLRDALSRNGREDGAPADAAAHRRRPSMACSDSAADEADAPHAVGGLVGRRRAARWRAARRRRRCARPSPASSAKRAASFEGDGCSAASRRTPRSNRRANCSTTSRHSDGEHTALRSAARDLRPRRAAADANPNSSTRAAASPAATARCSTPSSAAIKEDLLRVKDALDLHLRTRQTRRRRPAAAGRGAGPRRRHARHARPGRRPQRRRSSSAMRCTRSSTATARPTKARCSTSPARCSTWMLRSTTRSRASAAPTADADDSIGRRIAQGARRRWCARRSPISPTRARPSSPSSKPAGTTRELAEVPRLLRRSRRCAAACSTCPQPADYLDRRARCTPSAN